MQCNAMQCKRNANAMQTQRNATQHNAMQRNAMQYNTIQYNTSDDRHSISDILRSPWYKVNKRNEPITLMISYLVNILLTLNLNNCSNCITLYQYNTIIITT